MRKRVVSQKYCWREKTRKSMRLGAVACLEVAYLMRKSRWRLGRQNTLLYDLIYALHVVYVRVHSENKYYSRV